MDETKGIVSSQGRQSLDEKIKLSLSYGQSFWRIHCLQLRKTLIPITRRNEIVNTGPLFMILWKSIADFRLYLNFIICKESLYNQTIA